jgi:Mechanosensitive ion channel
MTLAEFIDTWIPAWVISAIAMIVPAVAVLVIYHWFIGRLIRLAGRYSPFLQKLLARGQGTASTILVIIPGSRAAGRKLPSASDRRALSRAAGGFCLGLRLGRSNRARHRRRDLPSPFPYRCRRRPPRPQARDANAHPAAGSQNPAGDRHSRRRSDDPRLCQTYGVSLFASAGAAGDHPQLGGAAVLSNLLAGIQIAMTQPIRVEDQVVVEGEFGSIETIASNYVVVRLWDLRRMVVPLTYFIEKPFQNWTYERTEQLGSVLLHVDYTVPVDRMSEKLNEIVRQTPLWDGRPDCKLPTRPTTWSNCGPWSARNPGQTWDLRCEVREKLIAFLQAEYPHALPRQRTEQLGIDLELSGGQNRRLRSV